MPLIFILEKLKFSTFSIVKITDSGSEMPLVTRSVSLKFNGRFVASQNSHSQACFVHIICIAVENYKIIPTFVTGKGQNIPNTFRSHSLAKNVLRGRAGVEKDYFVNILNSGTSVQRTQYFL